MNIEKLRNLQAEFEGKRHEIKRRFSELERLRTEFVKKFDPNTLSDMSLDDYIVGRGSHESFCYWLETRLLELGKIKGGCPADKKFGIYFGRTKNDPTEKYRFVKKFGGDYKEAYDNVRKEVIALIESGRKGDLERIAESKLSPMFKGKILSTYFPSKYFNVFCREHLDYFLEKAGLLDREVARLDEVGKREQLMQFKRMDAVMKQWSVYEFYTFLYEKFGWPRRNTGAIPKVLTGYVEPQYPPINEVNANFVEFSIAKAKGKAKPRRSERSGKPDHEKRNKENKLLGERGELIVLQKEKEYLASIGRKELVDKIDHTSQNNDSAGYDILSYDVQGNRKYIEVKSTKRKVSHADFIITATEMQKAQELDNYFVYVVFEAHTTRPKIVRVKKPFDLPADQLEITPVQFRIHINLKT